MSWQRNNWERKRDHQRASRAPAQFYEQPRETAFPVVRNLTTRKLDSIQALLQEALAGINPDATNTVVARGSHDAAPATTLLGIKEMRSIRPGAMPASKEAYLEALAEATETSDKHLEATIIGCGLFGARQLDSAKIGLTFDPDSTQQLLSERDQAIQLLEPSGQRFRAHPHLPLGQVYVENETMLWELKHSVRELGRALGAIQLLPVQADYRHP